jgi:hypothetical protein
MLAPSQRYGGNWADWTVRVLDDAGSEVYALRLTEVVATG